MHSGNLGGWVLSGAVVQEVVGQTGQEWSTEPGAWAAAVLPPPEGVLEPEGGRRQAVMGSGGSMQMGGGLTGEN